ncbi:hypothetical protein N7489_009948 [Penicillium chrysogenum]|uniref:uncharacterized protein n=1 Tax=Penicillium chrysogenum TaxID=5076 RepID=UPI0024DF07AB|nr:uncharacterized protein N7489_009948 [Penicillium chrysogenum]KAJ5229240.1 hypothetical protein N7489_009948 [Penicillium chrysogenum]
MSSFFDFDLNFQHLSPVPSPLLSPPTPSRFGDTAPIPDQIQLLGLNFVMLGRSILRASNRAVARQSLGKSTRASSTAAGAEAASSPFYLTLTAALATAAAAGSTAWYYHLYGQEAFAMTPAEEGLHATQYPWVHERFNKTFDHAALRRGFQVYREVCASCHSLSRVPWRSMVGTMHTVDEMKAFAEEHEYDTEPNNEGEIEKRPGKLSDYIPAPYPNEEAARAANGGALPPISA